MYNKWCLKMLRNNSKTLISKVTLNFTESGCDWSKKSYNEFFIIKCFIAEKKKRWNGSFSCEKWRMNRKKTKDLLRRAWHTNMKNLPVTPFHRNNINKSRYKGKKFVTFSKTEHKKVLWKISFLNYNVFKTYQ